METYSFSNLLYAAIRAEREQDALNRKWLRRLRAIERTERQPKDRTVIVRKPEHLAGVHKL